MKFNTKKLTMLAMLCAVAYIALFIFRIPVVQFLQYESKDVIIAIGGFIFGPLEAFLISLIVATAEFFTISDTGFIGAVMNVLSSACFTCAAAYFYKKNHTLKGAIIGLIVGSLMMTGVMLLWNYLITPIYMKYPREAVAKMLIPVFLPFNLLKAGINSALTLLLYKPVVTALRKANLIEPSRAKEEEGLGGKLHIGVVLIAVFFLITAALIILVWRGIL